MLSSNQALSSLAMCTDLGSVWYPEPAKYPQRSDEVADRKEGVQNLHTMRDISMSSA
jgi:hypothetical protein